MTNGEDTGALGPSGRFARMEAALDRIELKLDLKADNTRVMELEAKHNALEDQIRRMVNGETTSPIGQMYLQRFTDMEASIEAIEVRESNRQAILDATKQSADSRYSTLLWIVGISIVVNAIITISATVLARVVPS
jgi:hypothetical protein